MQSKLIKCGLSIFSLISASGSYGEGGGGSGDGSNGRNDAKNNVSSCSSQKSKVEQKADKTNMKHNSNKLFNAKTKVLGNGLRVVVVEDPGVPRVSVGILYCVGSCDDPDHLFGLSHMTEHMFFHGSQKYPNIDVTIANVGGSINACTSSDFTMYVTDCPTNALPLVFTVESDRMGSFNLKNVELFNQEQKAVYEERLMAVENPPLGIANEYIAHSLSPQHPYGREVIGSRRNILGYSVDAVMNHYKTWYAPNNATIIVVGAVNAEDVFALAEKHFGSLASRPVPERVRDKNSLEKDITHEIVHYSDKIASNKVCLYYPSLHRTTHSTREIAAIEIALETLFGSETSRFCWHFIDKKNMASELCVSFPQELDPMPMSITVSLMPGVSIESFLKAFSKEISNVVKNGISQEEFDRSKSVMIKNISVWNSDGHKSIRNTFINLAKGFSIEEIERRAEYLKEVTLSDVNSVLNSVFKDDPFAVVKVIPKGIV
ncbi:MAG: insulinase family protein [Holosporales bacterium]|jgi:zinc protease|nr:insulinase family protein [Holosporales bacterium]